MNFDSIGFSMKDQQTQRALTRYNVSGHFLSVFSNSSSIAMVASKVPSSLWHKRLTHPRKLHLSSLK